MKWLITLMLMVLLIIWFHYPLLRWVKNTYGNSTGYSGCSHCGDTWNWKKEHTIMYSEGSGMFPLCQDCFDTLSIEKVIDYCLDLNSKWIKGGSGLNLKEITFLMNEIQREKTK